MITTPKELIPHLEAFHNDITNDLAGYPERISQESYGHYDNSPACQEFSAYKPLLHPPAGLLDAQLEGAKDATSDYFHPGLEGHESGFELYIHLPEEGCTSPLILSAILNHQHSVLLPKSNWEKIGKNPRPRLEHTTAEARCMLRQHSRRPVEIDFTSWQTHGQRQMRLTGWRQVGNYVTDGDAIREDLDIRALTGVFGVIRMQIGLSLQELEKTQELEAAR